MKDETKTFNMRQDGSYNDLLCSTCKKSIKEVTESLSSRAVVIIDYDYDKHGLTIECGDCMSQDRKEWYGKTLLLQSEDKKTTGDDDSG